MTNPITNTLEQDQQKELTHLLVTGVVHDFNNLLTTILANTSLARQSAHPQTALYNQLFRAEKAAMQAKDLAADLLECAKGGSHAWEVLDLGGVVRSVAELASSGAEINMCFDNLEELWPVKVQKGPIGQVILNLIINAIQAMPKGGKVTISGKNVPGSPDQVQLIIQDEGEGIPEENLTRIFEPHFTTKSTGSGIGLAASKAIIEKHEGQIGVKSKVGEGTSFIICLAAQKEGASGKSQKEDVGPVKLYQGNGRLLLLEDDQLILNTMCDVLIYLGYEVDVATQGTEALQYYRSRKQAGEPFDAVILDLTLTQGMSSQEVIKQIQMDENVKIIVTSGYAEENFHKKNKGLKYAKYIQKPYTVEMLSKVVFDTLLKDK